MKVIKYDGQAVAQIENFDFLMNHLNISSLIHGRCFLSSDWHHEKIRSPFHRLYFILEGRGSLANGEREIALLPGHIYFIPADSVWTYGCDDYMDQFFIHLKINLMEGAELFEGWRDCIALEYPEKEIIRAVTSLEKESLEGILDFKGLLFKIVSELVVRSRIDINSRIDKARKYQHLFQYINEHRSASLKVSDVVEFMEKSHSSLYKDLKEDTGYSLKHFIDKSLMDASYELLLLTDLSVKEIAFELGFKDQYYFSRFFKKLAGLPPVRYRETNQLDRKITFGR